LIDSLGLKIESQSAMVSSWLEVVCKDLWGDAPDRRRSAGWVV
jgi:hypothetical protein